MIKTGMIFRMKRKETGCLNELLIIIFFLNNVVTVCKITSIFLPVRGWIMKGVPAPYFYQYFSIAHALYNNSYLEHAYTALDTIDSGSGGKICSGNEKKYYFLPCFF
jgi:hypothetical protein